MINWKGLYAAVKNIETTSETLHDINFTTELTRFLLIMNPTGIVETGTAGGSTTSFFAHLFPHLGIFSCDIFLNVEHLNKQFAPYTNIVCVHLDSRSFLPLITKEEVGERPFFFLDAHVRGCPNPMREEFTTIIDKLKSGEFSSASVCVHDFKVEDNPNFGYNTAKYDGTDLAWQTIEFIKPYAKAVWFPLGEPLTKHSRGRVYIYMSDKQPVLPTEFNILEHLGLMWRFI